MVDAEALFEQTRDICTRVEADLGVERDFIFDLHKEPDWTFLVKLGAIVEAAVNQLILAGVEDQRLHETIGRLRLRGPDSKLALAKDLDLLTTPQRRFVECVAQLRNSAVHDLRSFSLTLSGLLAAMPEQEEKQFWRDLLGVVVQEPGAAVRAGRVSDLAKFMIWLALSSFLDRLYWRKAVLTAEKEQEEFRRAHDAEMATRLDSILDLLMPPTDDSVDGEHS